MGLENQTLVIRNRHVDAIRRCLGFSCREIRHAARSIVQDSVFVLHCLYALYARR
jgi:hypothetical protein